MKIPYNQLQLNTSIMFDSLVDESQLRNAYSKKLRSQRTVLNIILAAANNIASADFSIDNDLIAYLNRDTDTLPTLYVYKPSMPDGRVRANFQLSGEQDLSISYDFPNIKQVYSPDPDDLVLIEEARTY